MAGYSARQSSFTTGDTITAAHSNDEFNQVLAAFNATTGHTHDGTAGEGGPVGSIRDADSLNKILVDSTNNHLEFYVEVSSSAVQQFRIQDGAIVPITDNDIDLGTSSLEFKDAFFDGTVTTDALVADTADINAGSIDGATLGTNSAITQAVIDNININGTTIGHTSDTDLLTLTSGVLTVAGEVDATSLDISGDADIDGTLEADAITVNGATLTEFITDAVGGMVSSNTETGISVTFEDGDNTLDFALGSSQTTISSLLNTSLVVGRDSDNDIDFATDNTILFRTDGADQIKLVNGALAPVTDNDIDLGTSSLEFKDAFFDGTVTADAFAGPLTGDVTGNVSGTAATVTTAAQSNITSLGTLTTLTVDNVITNGATIGHTDDTDLITLADGIATVAGEISVTTLDIGGTNVSATAAEISVTTLDIGGTNVSATAAEINLIDGDTARGTTAVADADGILHNDAGTMRMTSAATFKTYFTSGVSSAADDLTAGDSAVNLTTSSGDITIDAAANDSDIIFKGTDATADITMLTLDGSEAGAATFNNKIVATELDISGDVDVDGTLEADAITVDGTTLAEFISDTTGAMFSSNTETGITATYQDADNTIDLALDAAQTTITSLLATDIKIGEDDQTKIDFETADTIHFYAGNQNQLKLTDGVLAPVTDNDVDLGTSSLEFKNVYVDGTVFADALGFGTVVMTLPTADGSANQILTTDGSGALSFVDNSGGTEWQAVKTSNFTASAGQGVFANTSGGSFTVTLPASPSLGDEVSIKDYAGTFDTNALTIGRNSQPIEGVAEDLTVSVERAGFTLAYSDSTQGWLLKDK